MPNKTLTVNLDPKIEAKLSGFFDGLTANLTIVKEEYERVLCLFYQANKAKRMERQMRIDAQEANWEATKYIAAIGRVIGNDRDPNQMETAGQVIDRIINERDAAIAQLQQEVAGAQANVQSAVAAEREACAQIADRSDFGKLIAHDIRARGETQETSPTIRSLDP